MNDPHYCQEEGTTGLCIICHDLMPVEPADHYHQEEGNTGHCILCGASMSS